MLAGAEHGDLASVHITYGGVPWEEAEKPVGFLCPVIGV